MWFVFLSQPHTSHTIIHDLSTRVSPSLIVSILTSTLVLNMHSCYHGYISYFCVCGQFHCMHMFLNVIVVTNLICQLQTPPPLPWRVPLASVVHSHWQWTLWVSYSHHITVMATLICDKIVDLEVYQGSWPRWRENPWREFSTLRQKHSYSCTCKLVCTMLFVHVYCHVIAVTCTLSLLSHTLVYMYMHKYLYTNIHNTHTLSLSHTHVQTHTHIHTHRAAVVWSSCVTSN